MRSSRAFFLLCGIDIIILGLLLGAPAPAWASPQAKLYSLPSSPSFPSPSTLARFVARFPPGRVLRQSDAAYWPSIQTYNLRTGPPQPLLVVYAATPVDVALALSLARNHTLRLAVRSTGHHQDVRNTADAALLLDLSLFNARRLDLASQTITVLLPLLCSCLCLCALSS